MDSSGKYAAARFSKAKPQPSYYKNALIAVSYAVASSIVALCIWPASAGDILAKFNATASPTFTSDVSNRIHNENRVRGGVRSRRRRPNLRTKRIDVNRGLKAVPRKSRSAASWHLAALSEKEISARAASQASTR